jgi:peptidoglycan-associated lipoprotein
MVRESIVRLAGVAAMALLIGTLGCQTTQEAPPPSDTGEWDDGPTPPPTTRDTTPMSDVKTVYFDFDKSEIRPDARDTLKSNAAMIGKEEGGTVTIEGHCDERGSTEYNLALGERRANAVKRYLVDLGVPSSRLRTVSFGEDRPAVQGHDESAWRYNRRADFAR